jgi:ethanolamine utilization protein EutQ (cupin superfamily)
LAGSCSRPSGSGGTTLSGLESKRFDSPDEVRQFQANGHVDLVKMDSGPIGKGTFEPGWKWSNDVKPIAGTDSCQVEHVGYVVSGRMKVVMDDGSEIEVGPGDAFHMPPGHDAWTVGDEACVLLDFAGLKGYALPSG